MLYIYGFICVLYTSEVNIQVEICILTLDFTMDESRKGSAENFDEE